MVKLFYKLTLLLLLILSATLLYQKDTYAYHTLIHIDPIPHTEELIQRSQYVDAYEYLNYFMAFDYVQHNPQARVLLKQINEKRHSLSYQSEKVLEGISTGTSDELLGQASAIGSDFFVLGDIRDLVIEATHYVKDEEVDSLLVALSGIGLVATAGTLYSGGGAAVIKTGVSVLKLAKKSKRMPSWLGSFIVRQSKHIRKGKDLSSLTPLFSALDTLRRQVGLPQTLKLLSHTTSLKALQKLTQLSKRYGKNTATLLKLSNKQIVQHAHKLKNIDMQTIKQASSYGKSGFTHLLKHGEKNFLKTTKRLKAYAKIGHKGEAWKMALWAMKSISDNVLFLVMGMASFLMLPWRKILEKK